MVALSPEEQALVTKYSLKFRPDYYSFAHQQSIPISEDLEAFIILMPPEARQDVVNWIKENTRYANQNTARNDLLAESLNLEMADADAQLVELNTMLNNYNKFRESYFKNIFPETSQNSTTNSSVMPTKQQRFASVAEVGQVLSDLNTAVQENLSLQDRAQHLRVLSSILLQILNGSKITPDQKSQAASWAGPFSTYTNGRD